MKIEVLSQKKNVLMGREEVSLRIHHEGQKTPSRHDMLKEVARSLKADERNIIIDRIFTLQGEAVSEANVLAYENKDSIPAYSLEKMKRRMKVKAAAAE